MPTYVITDDTKSLCLAISGGETKNIDKDNAVVRVLPANTGLNTTAIDQLSIEHDGHFATRIPYNDVTVSGVSPSSVLDFRTKVLTILNNNSSGGSSASITVTRTVAVQMEGATSGQTYPVENQWYIIQNLHITGIDQIRTIGVIDQTTGNGIFSKNAEAYVTALSTYVPCTYDVATNTLQFDYLLWAGHISQAGTDAPTIISTNYNISGETPLLNYDAVGSYNIVFTGNKLVSSDAVKHFSFIYDLELQGFYTIQGETATGARIKSGRNGALEDARLDNAYIEIRLVYIP